jgi:putative ABC transport system permease protein
VDAILRDVRLALRALRLSPGFSATALVILTLSIGGVTSIFSAIEGALLRPLRGISGQDALVWVSSVRQLDGRPRGMAFPDFVELHDGLPSGFTKLAAYDAVSLGLATGGTPTRIRGHVVSDDYFGALGTSPARGRFLDRRETKPDAGVDVVVLGDRLWRTRFGADPGVIGAPVMLNGQSFTVVGVAAPGFAGPELGAPADVWVPLGAAQAVAPDLSASVERRDRFPFRVFGRLQAGASPRTVGTALSVVSDRLAREYRPSHQDLSFRVSAFRGGATPDVLGETVGTATLVLLVGLLVLVISCFNVANLLLARAVRRMREWGVRLALGASRWQLARYAMTESLLLALFGGAAGVLLSRFVLRLLAGVGPEMRSVDLGIDAGVLAFALVVTVGTALVFGVLPAVHQARRVDADVVLGEHARGATQGAARSRLQSAFMVIQLAVSLVLLCGAGQVIGLLRRAVTVDLGFAPEAVTTVSYDPSLAGYGAERRAALNDIVLDRLSALPGVAAVALVDAAPLSGVMVADGVTPEGAQGPVQPVGVASVAGNYFEALGIPLMRGRAFTAADRAGSPPVAIVNATAAGRLWPGEEPLGKHLRFEGRDGLVEVVGVARDTRYDDPLEDPMSFVYLPMEQRTTLSTVTVIARGAGGRALPPDDLRNAVQRLEPALALFDARTLPESLRDRLDRQEATGKMLSLAGLAGLLIAAIGLFGVVSYTVAQRTREIGIRQALGATPGAVVWMVVRHGLRLAGAGAALGALLALPVGAVLNGALFAVPLAAMGGLGAAAAMLIVVAAAASYLPARRAARIDPATAFRDA